MTPEQVWRSLAHQPTLSDEQRIADLAHGVMREYYDGGFNDGTVLSALRDAWRAGFESAKEHEA